MDVYGIPWSSTGIIHEIDWWNANLADREFHGIPREVVWECKAFRWPMPLQSFSYLLAVAADF